jgi:hypothetical protein
MTPRARKPPAPKPPQLPAEPKAPAKRPEIRPLTSVPALAVAVTAGDVTVESMTPVEGHPELVDISWKGRVGGKAHAATLRTSRQAAQARGIAA